VDIADRLRELRTATNKTQKEIASTLGVSVSTVGMYETGKRIPKPDTLKKLAQLYNVSSDYLIGIVKKESPDYGEEKKPKDLLRFLDHAEVMFDGETYDLIDEDRKKIKAALELAFWDAKERNRRKRRKPPTQ
jgi:transcriptional regulator with XRE-family HTH domain